MGNQQQAAHFSYDSNTVNHWAIVIAVEDRGLLVFFDAKVEGRDKRAAEALNFINEIE